MKKNLLIVLSMILLSSAANIAYSKNAVTSDVSSAIKMYKAGNYAECYVKIDSAIAKDPSNGLAYYYKAMSAAQIGKQAEAIENYGKALNLAPQDSNLYRYAEKGKRCLETPDKCHSAYDDETEAFIRGKNKGGFSNEVREQYEKLKLKDVMREMNTHDDIQPDKFREYKDFSSMNTPDGAPSNDEIVAAIRTLQKAGLYNNYNQAYSELSLLTGENYNNNQNALYSLMGKDSINPQLIQTMLTNNMSLGF